MNAYRGAALIIAMLVAALAAVIAMSIATAQQQWAATVMQRRDQVQAQALALAGVQWARQIMFDDAAHGSIDHLGEPWALPLPATPIENGSIEGRIIDAQGLLNVNDLGSAAATGSIARQRFTRLFASLGLPSALLDTLGDWVDTDNTVRQNGAEDAWYLAQTPPSLAANAPMVRASEAALVKGIVPQSLETLLPNMTALPAGTQLNVNTAPPAVLATVADGLAGGPMATLVATRGQRPFSSIADFRSRLPQGITLGDETTLSVSSQYFLVTVRARQGETPARARALLKRGGSGWPTIVWQVIE